MQRLFSSLRKSLVFFFLSLFFFFSIFVAQLLRQSLSGFFPFSFSLPVSALYFKAPCTLGGRDSLCEHVGAPPVVMASSAGQQQQQLPGAMEELSAKNVVDFVVVVDGNSHDANCLAPVGAKASPPAPLLDETCRCDVEPISRLRRCLDWRSEYRGGARWKNDENKVFVDAL